MARLMLLAVMILSAVLAVVCLNDAQHLTLEQIANDTAHFHVTVTVMGYLMALMAIVSGVGLVLEAE